MRLKIKFNKFLIRLKTCYNILTGKWRHFVVLNVDDNNLTKLLQDKPFDTKITYHGVQPYIYYRIIKTVSATCSDVDMIIAKAEFEVAASEYKKQNENF